MESIAAAAVVAALLTALLIWAHERHGLLASDRFPTPSAKWVAYAQVAALAFIVAALVIQSSTASGNLDVQAMNFWALFTLHLLLVLFLIGWWSVSGRPPLASFLNLRGDGWLQNVFLGVGIGVAGWVATIAIAIGVGLALQTSGVLPDDLRPSPVIPWMAALPLWKKSLIILSAMTVEEAFFRGWLQKRVGLILSTLLFAVSHAGYGQPLLLIGVTVVSLVIGYTFYRTRNLWPCIVAHGVFDAIQLFIVVPLVLQASGVGA